jgi:PAS domain S-box-containing protein
LFLLQLARLLQGPDLLPIWFPGAGLSLAFLAWFGTGVVGLLVLDLILGVGVGWLLGQPHPGLAFVGGLLQIAQVTAGWLLYHHVGRGARSLGEPRSATLFLLTLLGLSAGLSALLYAGFLVLVDFERFGFLACVGTFWLAQGLGVALVAPPLLVWVTPWLLRRKLITPVGPGLTTDIPSSQLEWIIQRGLELPGRLSLGDLLEITGLSLTAGVLGLVLSWLLIRREGSLPDWQLWGAPLLVIVWAGLRQGLRGATLVAACGALCPLFLVLFQPRSLVRPELLQANLLAQCGTALLVAASITWVRLSEARFRQMVGQIPVVLYSASLIDRGGKDRPFRAEVSFVSPGCLAILGCSPVVLLGDFTAWLERIHPDDREVLLAACRQLERQSHPVTFEYRLAHSEDLASTVRGGGTRSPSGSPPAGAASASGVAPPRLLGTPRSRWLRETMIPQYDSSGRLQGWEGMISDITEQHDLADDLRRTTSMFYALVSNLPAGVFFIQGPHGRPILVNARARQLLGQREDPAAGLDHLSQVYRLFKADGSPYPRDDLPVTQALRLGSVCMRDDIVVHRADGRHIPLVSWAAPVSLGGTSNDAAVWVLEDLTSLRQAEAARRESEARMRAVIESLGEGLLVQDKNGVIVEANPTAANLIGWPVEQLRGRTWPYLRLTWLREDGSALPPDEFPDAVVLRTGRPVRNLVLGLLGDCRFSSDDGRASIASQEVVLGSAPAATRPSTIDNVRKWVLINCLPLGLQPTTGPAGVITSLTDITEQVAVKERIHLSATHYREMIDAFPMLVVQFDRNLRLIYLNPAAEIVLGTRPEDLAAPEAWQALLLPEDLPCARATLEAILAGESRRTEFRFRTSAGATHSAYGVFQPQYSAGPEPRIEGILALLIDLTPVRGGQGFVGDRTGEREA